MASLWFIEIFKYKFYYDIKKSLSNPDYFLYGFVAAPD